MEERVERKSELQKITDQQFSMLQQQMQCQETIHVNGFYAQKSAEKPNYFGNCG